MSRVADRDARVVGLAGVRDGLRRFAADYAHLPLYRRIASAAADDELVAAILTPRPARAGPAVLLLAAIHDLVSPARTLPAARWYPASSAPPTSQPRATPGRRSGRPFSTTASSSNRWSPGPQSQTNEVNRTAYLAPLLADVAADLPIATWCSSSWGAAQAFCSRSTGMPSSSPTPRVAPSPTAIQRRRSAARAG